MAKKTSKKAKIPGRARSGPKETTWQEKYLYPGSKSLLAYALYLRIILTIYGEIQDKYYDIKYSDIDYSVYTDAAGYLVKGGTPYDRHTYRYTPLLAYLMIPNILYAHVFGKIVFCFCDIWTAVIIRSILQKTTDLSSDAVEQMVGIWALNPLIFNVSTRGNADTMVALQVVGVLLLLLQKRFVSAAFLFGFVVHFKIYPIIYALPIYFWIDMNRKPYSFFTKNRVKFTLISACTFLGIVGFFYAQFGWEFLYETYLYHFIRKDNRHNFSVYFYYFYLNFEKVTKVQSAMAFVPQLALLVLSGYKFFHDLPFCMFVQTFIFVTFNKVCTAQYFLWYMVYFSLFLYRNKLYSVAANRKKLILMWVVWFALVLLWNVGAHLLEGQGVNVFLELWVGSMAFFLVNIYIVTEIIRN